MSGFRVWSDGLAVKSTPPHDIQNMLVWSLCCCCLHSSDLNWSHVHVLRGCLCALHVGLACGLACASCLDSSSTYQWFPNGRCVTAHFFHGWSSVGKCLPSRQLCKWLCQAFLSAQCLQLRCEGSGLRRAPLQPAVFSRPSPACWSNPLTIVGIPASLQNSCGRWDFSDGGSISLPRCQIWQSPAMHGWRLYP